MSSEQSSDISSFLVASYFDPHKLVSKLNNALSTKDLTLSEEQLVDPIFGSNKLRYVADRRIDETYVAHLIDEGSCLGWREEKVGKIYVVRGTTSLNDHEPARFEVIKLKISKPLYGADEKVAIPRSTFKLTASSGLNKTYFENPRYHKPLFLRMGWINDDSLSKIIAPEWSIKGEYLESFSGRSTKN